MLLFCRFFFFFFFFFNDTATTEIYTLSLHDAPPICIQIFPPPPECYRVGLNNRATAFILDNDVTPPPTNGPVFVNIVARDAFASEGTHLWGTNNPAVFVLSRT